MLTHVSANNLDPIDVEPTAGLFGKRVLNDVFEKTRAQNVEAHMLLPGLID